MNEHRAREGVEHLQAAALEMIAAMRAFLDVAEDVVRDPTQVAAMVQGLAETAKAATATSPGGPGRGTGEPADEPGVTRIRVS